MKSDRNGILRCLVVSLFALSLVEMPMAAFAVSPELVDNSSAILAPDQQIAQVLDRLTFGARPGDYEAVQKVGLKRWIDAQLDPGTIDDTSLDKRLAKLPTLNLATPVLAEQYNPPPPKPKPSPTPVASPAMPSMTVSAPTSTAAQTTAANTSSPISTPSVAPLAAVSPTPTPRPTPPPKNPGMVVNEIQRAKLLRAVYSERQLNEVMVDFWENHFSIYANKDADRWLLTGFDREAIRPFALGRFRDLLGATAHSPAMLFYLDNWQSSVVRTVAATKDKPERKYGGINENYARELMELHTMGVDGGYTQRDVQEVARCFTGWTIRNPNQEGLFYFNPAIHDNGEKVVLGVKIPAGGGIADAERVLDILARHPSTAHFVATKMARRFLGDDPPKAVVDRAAAAYLKTDGSIVETLRAILDSPEFLSPKYFQTKVRSPFEYVAAALRSTSAETDATNPVLGWINRMGQPVYGRVTPDGYPDRNSEWLSNNDLLARFNFAVALTTNQIRGTKIESSKFVPSPDKTPPPEMLAVLAREFYLGQMSSSTRTALAKAISDAIARSQAGPPAVIPASQQMSLAPAPPKKDVSAEILALTLSAPEFQRK